MTPVFCTWILVAVLCCDLLWDMFSVWSVSFKTFTRPLRFSGLSDGDEKKGSFSVEDRGSSKQARHEGDTSRYRKTERMACLGVWSVRVMMWVSSCLEFFYLSLHYFFSLSLHLWSIWIHYDKKQLLQMQDS